jgi:hypothetical protein
VGLVGDFVRVARIPGGGGGKGVRVRAARACVRARAVWRLTCPCPELVD